MGKRKKCWSYTAGKRPYRVRVFENPRRGGLIYWAAWDPTARGGQGGEITRSLGHKDSERAISFADDMAAKLRRGIAEHRQGRPTVRRVFSLYAQHCTPDKSAAVQQDDQRRRVLFTRFLGPDKDLSKIGRGEWDTFVRQRLSGAIGPRGEPVPPEKRVPLSPRTVERDLKGLRATIKWATTYRTPDGTLLMEKDPTRGLSMPDQKNTNRPVASHDRVDALRKVAHRIRMRIEWGGHREHVESYLPELIEIAVGTGRRISAIRQLRAENLDLVRSPDAPWGAINWPEDTDKQGKKWRCPISAPVREALESALRKRRAVGPGWLFPAPSDPSKPVRYRQALTWLREAEREANLDPVPGGAYHMFRRLFATARKDLPDVDVAQAGGWSSLEALKLAYQQPDDATLLRVVTAGTELREVR